MKESEALQQFKTAIEDVEKTGQNSIPTVNLKNYLDLLLRDAAQREAGLNTSTEEQRAHGLEVWKTQVGMFAEMLKATTEAGQTALKSAILINGGAAVAMLAFVGNAVTKSDLRPGSPILSHIGGALLIFMVGTGLAGTSTAFRYISQWCYAEAVNKPVPSRERTCGHAFSIVAVLLGIGSFTAFFAGGWLAFKAILTP
ncbi:hypothetical protein [Paraburkholderia sp. RL17-373-BIF-A]|uniref:hypothetical protein n=1 Tax=Paraburkholderia sp. RL17-373-BIF-A TaxID=3031629 RepID=UPI0038B7BF43